MTLLSPPVRGIPCAFDELLQPGGVDAAAACLERIEPTSSNTGAWWVMNGMAFSARVMKQNGSSTCSCSSTAADSLHKSLVSLPCDSTSSGIFPSCTSETSTKSPEFRLRELSLRVCKPAVATSAVPVRLSRPCNSLPAPSAGASLHVVAASPTQNRTVLVLLHKQRKSWECFQYGIQTVAGEASIARSGCSAKFQVRSQVIG